MEKKTELSDATLEMVSGGSAKDMEGTAYYPWYCWDCGEIDILSAYDDPDCCRYCGSTNIHLTHKPN